MPYYSIGFAVALLCIAVWRAVFFESGYSVYYTDDVPPSAYAGISIRESAKAMGIDFFHSRLSTGVGSPEYSNLTIPPALAVFDLNQDGFQDLIFSGLLKPVVYVNDRGHGFKKIDSAFGFEIEQESPASMVILADFNRDGVADAFVSGHPKHYLYYGEQTHNGLHFKPAFDKTASYLSNPDGVNVLDFNQDGRLDLVFGNYTAKPGEGTSEVLWLGANRYDNKTGGANDLLIQSADGTFQLNRRVNFRSRSYTHSVGVADFNRDGFPDVFFANDYARDELFINQNGKSVVDVTQKQLPIEWHGNSGMNAEIVDYNGDGRPDIYVTNIYKPPFYNAVNLLWEQQQDGNFVVTSVSKNVAKCGFSWGAKFLDINNDGRLDLAVTNGRNRAPDEKHKGEGESLWYRRSMVSRIPNVVRQYYYEQQLPQEKFSVSAFERDCLFVQGENDFYDVAPHVGISSEYEGRALAVIDIENDGRLDYVVANLQGPIEIFHNLSTTTGNWIGLELFDKNGSNLPIGAIITLTTKSGKKIVREYYPANGYRSQSDPRVHFGLGTDIPLSVEVQWSTKAENRKSYPLSKHNIYVKIHEKN